MIAIATPAIEDHYLVATERHGEHRDGLVLSLLVEEGVVRLLVEWDVLTEHFVEVVTLGTVVLSRKTLMVGHIQPVAPGQN